MPDKQFTAVTYAAGASLAAITLVYVFAPTFFIDGDANEASNGRKRLAVGLSNTANDCFINSVLQALAGLGDLRLYLIREIHRRQLDGDEIYEEVAGQPPRKTLPEWKLNGLQRGIVTKGLKNMLDALNERPPYKKTISVAPFVASLEDAFRQRISRQQQDAQEFLQVVAERLCEEYHAGHRSRRRALHKGILKDQGSHQQSLDGAILDRQLSRLAEEADGHLGTSDEKGGEQAEQHEPNNHGKDGEKDLTNEHSSIGGSHVPASFTKSENTQAGVVPATEEDVNSDTDLVPDDEDGFPFEGKWQSQIECLTCGFKPKPSLSDFCTLTLNVPQGNSTTLNACFDGMFKTEYIDDFKCDKCRLVHAVDVLTKELDKGDSDLSRSMTAQSINRIKSVIETNPEELPKDVKLPTVKSAPTQRIARHVKITKFPKVLAIHLSRSIFDAGRSSMKNSAKVAFPERLPLGGLLEHKKYKLLGLVTHKGSHHSGHYESFRRQNIYAPFSTPNVFNKSGVYSKAGTPNISHMGTPQLQPSKLSDDPSTTPEALSPELPSAASSRTSLASPSTPLSPACSSTDSTSRLAQGHSRGSQSTSNPGPTSAPRDPDTNSIRSVARSARTTFSKMPSSISNGFSRSSTTRSQSEALSTHRRRLDEGTPTADSTPASARKASSGVPGKRKKPVDDRWWRISDDKVKESKTNEVLKMQREVYLLFYELERDHD